MPLRTRRTSTPKHKAYQRYKPYLREDFAYACVYCGMHENEAGGPRFFTVEHFRPKSRFPQLATEYTNLLYACSVCNTYKSNDWPHDDPLAAGAGYLDPCEHDYDQHFGLAEAFVLIGHTAVARYMIDRLHLNRPMLQKLRRQRHEQAELHEQFVALFAQNMALLGEHLREAALTASQRRQLAKELERLRRQFERHVESWEKRWQPLYSLDDYR
jgi:hypothetical protein